MTTDDEIDLTYPGSLHSDKKMGLIVARIIGPIADI